MANSILLGLLPEDDSRLPEWLATADDLARPLGDGEHALPARLEARVESSSLQVAGTPVSGWARVGATASFQGTGWDHDVYSTGVRCPLGADRNTGVLDLEAALGSSLEASADFSGGALALDASLGAGIRYRHFLPLPEEVEREDAYRKLIFGSRLPHGVDLAKPLEPGEVHRLDAKLAAGLGLKVSAGKAVAQDVVLDLSDRLSIPFETDVRAAVEAALGLSFTGRMMVVVGRACTDQSGWTRIRIQRENARRLSFGLTFSLTMRFDMGAGLVQLFEEMTDTVPTPRLVRTARKILQYRDPEVLKEKLTGEAAEVLEDLLAEGIVESLEEAAELAGEVVDFYDGLEGELQGLWDRLLSQVDLGEESARGRTIRGWLDRLSGLDPSTLQLEDLFSGDDEVAEVVEIVEALTGRTVEDLLLEGELEEAGQRVAKLAKRAKGLLEGTPGTVLEKIREFNRATGIERIVEELRALETGDDLDESVRLRLRRVAERLVGKAWDTIDGGDLQRIKAWADKADRYLSLLDPEDQDGEAAELMGKIKKQLREVKMDYGLSLAFEVERLARDTALLDVEIDPGRAGKKLLEPLSKALFRGDVREALLALVDRETRKEGKADDDDEVTLPFAIRECVFTSERIRTSAFSAIFDLAGLGGALSGRSKSFTQRIRQASLRIAPEDGVVRRTARHAAGFVRGNSPGKMSAGAGVWLVNQDSADGADFRKPYDGDPETTLRLVFWYEDRAADATELRGLDFLLYDLGFLPDHRLEAAEAEPDPRAPSRVVEAGRGLGLSLEVRFPAADLVGELLAAHGDAAGRKGWDRAFLNAVHRWGDETFVTGTPKGSNTRGRTVGEILAAATADPFFIHHARSTGQFQGDVLGELNGRWPLSIGGTRIPLEFFRQGTRPGGQLEVMIYGLIKKREALRKRVNDLDDAWRKAFGGGRTEEGYLRLSRAFARNSARMSLHRVNWPNPTSLFWLWLAAINELHPDTLAQGRGIAILRPEPEDETTETTGRPPVEAYTVEGIPDNRPPHGRIFSIRG